MTPEAALEHVRCERYISWAELVRALRNAVAERDQARTERDSLAAALSVADVRVAYEQGHDDGYRIGAEVSS